jgi:hypothetical protein
MPQTFNVGSRSRFVNLVAWLAILLGAFACAWAVIQNADHSSWASAQAARDGLPWLSGLLLRYLPWVFSCAVALSLATLVCAIGLLRRVEWARRLFIGLLAVAIAVVLGGVWLQQELAQVVVDDTLRHAALSQRTAELFGGMVIATRALAGALSVMAGLALAAVIRRLMSSAVRQEFA